MRSSFILSKNRQEHKPGHCFVGNQTQYQLKHTRLAKTQKYHRLVKKKKRFKKNIMWDERKNPDWAPKIFKTQRIQTQKFNTNLEISCTNPENQTQEQHSPALVN